MSDDPTTVAGTKKSLFATIRKWYPAGLALMLIGTIVQCTVERQNSRIAAEQSQNLSRVSEFLQTGAELDRKVAQLNDALADRSAALNERAAFRDALAKHASVAMQLENEFGVQATREYMQQLDSLSDTVERTQSAESPGPVISKMSNVIVSRRALAAKAESKI